MKKNILSVVAVGLVLSTVGGVIATQPADAQCNNNRNQARQIRRMLQRQARCNQQFNNPYFTQVNPGFYNAGYNPYAYGNQFGNPYYNYNNGFLGNGLVGNGLRGILGTLF